jgi:branched-chain amino acid transport system permease protein
VLCEKHLGIGPGVGFVAVVLLTGLFAFGVGLVIVRAPGIAFAMITLAIGQVFYLLVSKARGVTGGADGLVIDLPERLFGLPSGTFGGPASMFVVSWLTLVCILLMLSLVLKSRFGPLTEAIRENEERTRFIGFATVVPRAAVYAISAMVCSVAGVLSSLYTGFVSPESIHWSLSGSFLIAALIGGSSMLSGPVIGAVAYFLLRDLLSHETTHWLSILGVCLIVVVVFWPEGIAGGLSRGAEKFRPKGEEST